MGSDEPVANGAPACYKFGSGQVEDLLLWKDPVKTGCVLGAATTFYALFELSGWTALSITANLLLLCVVATFVYSTAAGVVNLPPLPIPEPDPDAVDQLVGKAVAGTKGTVNCALAVGYRLAKAQEPALSIKAGFALYLLAKVGGLCNFLTLVYLTCLSALTFPKVYEMYKDEIDKVHGMVADQFKTYFAQAKGLADKHVLSKIQHLMPSKPKEAAKEE